MTILPGQIRYLGARATLVRQANAPPVPGYELLFSLPNGETHSAVLPREGFTRQRAEEAIIAAATPFLELADIFKGD